MKNVFAKLIHIRKEFEHQVKLLATGDSRRRRGLNPNVTEDENSAKLKRTEAALKNCDRINLKLKRNLNACSNGNKAKKGNANKNQDLANEDDDDVGGGGGGGGQHADVKKSVKKRPFRKSTKGGKASRLKKSHKKTSRRQGPIL